MKLIVTRHGKTLENISGTFQGRNPGTLSDEGIAQAKLFGGKLSGTDIDIAYSSPSGRCKETLRLILEGMQSNPQIQYNDALLERDFGELTGKKLEPSMFDLLENDTAESRKMNIESTDNLYKRVKDFIDSVREKDKRKTVVIVTHSSTLAAILMYFFNKPFKEIINTHKIKNASYTEFEIDDKTGEVKQIALNDVSHLEK